MGKYLHLFDSLPDFDGIYNGSAYTEPWVSYTTGTTGQITTAFTFVIMPYNGNNVEDQYLLNKIFSSPVSVLDMNDQPQKIYGEYLPKTHADLPPIYSITPLDEITEFNLGFLAYGIDGAGEKTFNYDYDGPWGLSAGTANISNVDYNKMEFRLVASYSGDTNVEGFEMDIVEDTIAKNLPFFPEYSEDESMVENVYCHFIVNGETMYEGITSMGFDQNGRYKSLRLDVDGVGLFTYRFNLSTGERLVDGYLY